MKSKYTDRKLISKLSVLKCILNMKNSIGKEVGSHIAVGQSTFATLAPTNKEINYSMKFSLPIAPLQLSKESEMVRASMYTIMKDGLLWS